MGRYYSQLTQEQRYTISILKRMTCTQTHIADMVCVNKSTITRELKRNHGSRGYRPKQAHQRALVNRQQAKKHIKFTSALAELVIEKLQLDWSPDQISGYLRKAHNLSISHERIYRFILADKQAGGTLCTHLRHSGKKRKKRYGAIDRRGQIKNRVSIDA